LVDEFHFSAVFKSLDPLFIWHFRISSARPRHGASIHCLGAKIADGNEELPPGDDLAFGQCTENYNAELPFPRVLTRTNKS
jgi:hypothetical protein